MYVLRNLHRRKMASCWDHSLFHYQRSFSRCVNLHKINKVRDYIAAAFRVCFICILMMIVQQILIKPASMMRRALFILYIFSLILLILAVVFNPSRLWYMGANIHSTTSLSCLDWCRHRNLDDPFLKNLFYLNNRNYILALTTLVIAPYILL